MPYNLRLFLGKPSSRYVGIYQISGVSESALASVASMTAVASEFWHCPLFDYSAPNWWEWWHPNTVSDDFFSVFINDDGPDKLLDWIDAPGCAKDTSMCASSPAGSASLAAPASPALTAGEGPTFNPLPAGGLGTPAFEEWYASVIGSCNANHDSDAALP